MYHCILFFFTGSLTIQPLGTSQGVLRVTEGEELLITCRYRGSGAGGRFRWVGPGVGQGRATTTRHRSKSKLHFSPLIADDNGTYVCLFANEAATVEIIVQRECVQLSTQLQREGLVTQDSSAQAVFRW